MKETLEGVPRVGIPCQATIEQLTVSSLIFVNTAPQ